MKLFEEYEALREGHKHKGALLEKKVEDHTGRSLTKVEIQTLVHIRRLEQAKLGTTCTDLTRMLGVTLPQVTALYRGLEKQRLVKSPKPSRYDRRQRFLHTTNTGAAIAEYAEEIDG